MEGGTGVGGGCGSFAHGRLSKNYLLMARIVCSPGLFPSLFLYFYLSDFGSPGGLFFS